MQVAARMVVHPEDVLGEPIGSPIEVEFTAIYRAARGGYAVPGGAALSLQPERIEDLHGECVVNGRPMELAGSLSAGARVRVEQLLLSNLETRGR